MPKEIPEKKNSEATKSKSKKYDETQMRFNSNSILYITYILKLYSDREHPLSPSQIAEKLDFVFPDFQIDKESIRKNIIRTLQRYTKDNAPEASTELTDFQIRICTIILGGNIIARERKTKTSKRFLYYFEPLLVQDDLMLLCSSIITNRHLHKYEKDYLIRNTHLLADPKGLVCQELSCTDLSDIDGDTVRSVMSQMMETDNPKEYLNDREKTLLQPKRASSRNIKTSRSIKNSSLLWNRNFLNHASLIHRAISREIMIAVVYGRYSQDKNTDHTLTFEIKATPKKKPSLLNPYGLLWSQGQLYLIATHAGHTNPVHYRVDRIIHIRFARTDDLDDTALPSQKQTPEKSKKAEKKEPSLLPREEIPESLQPYFQVSKSIFGQKKNKMDFKPGRYLTDHPLMGATVGTRKNNYVLRVSERGLALLFDHFGDIVSVKPSPGKQTETDINGKPLLLYDAAINDIFEDNMLLFCTRYHNMVTPVSPDSLRNAVRESLIHSLKNLEDEIPYARISSTTPYSSASSARIQ